MGAAWEGGAELWGAYMCCVLCCLVTSCIFPLSCDAFTLLLICFGLTPRHCLSMAPPLSRPAMGH